MTAGVGARRVSPLLPLAYLAAAATAFVLGTAGTVLLGQELAGHYYHPRLTALTHTFTLGWISLSIMGASFQLVPVLLERPIRSPRLGAWQLGVLAPGIAGMAAHLWLGTWPGLALAAALVGVGVACYLGNILLSLRGLVRWSFTARALLLGLVGLALTTLFGLGLALDRLQPWLPGGFFGTLHAHAHLALLGWVAPVILGVAARAYPMFLVAEEPGGWPTAAQLWGLALGVPALTAGLLAVPRLVLPGALAVALALAAHLVWVVRLAAARRRPGLDWGLRLLLTGAALLPAALALGLALAAGVVSGPRAALAYAVLGLGGWVSLTIAGMMLKIVPFLVWYRVWAPRVGEERVPTLAELSWPPAERLAGLLLGAGMPLLAVAVWLGLPWAIRLAGTVLAAGALALATALGASLAQLRHARVPRVAAASAARP